MAFMCIFTVDSVITSLRAMILFDALSSAKSPAPVATGFSARPLPPSTAHLRGEPRSAAVAVRTHRRVGVGRAECLRSEGYQARQGLHRSFAEHTRWSGWSLPNFVARKRKLLIFLSVPLKLDVNCL